MDIHLNDETLTAYALGELTAAESEAIDTLLADPANSEARRTLDEIRATIALSQQAFASTGAHEGLSTVQRDTVVSMADAAPSRYRFPWRAAGLAAAVLLVVTLYGALSMYEAPETRVAVDPPSQETPEERAKREFNELSALEMGIERFFITDINNPGASASIRPDFNDPEVQTQLGRLRDAAGAIPLQSDGRLNYSTYDPALRVETERQVSKEFSDIRREQQEKSMAELAAAAAPSTPAPPFQVRQQLNALGYGVSGNDGVQTFGLRDTEANRRTVNWNPRRANPSRSPAESAPSQALAVEERTNLTSLGYLTGDESPGPAANAPRTEAGYRYQTAAVEPWRDRPLPPVASPGSEAYKPIVERGFLRVTNEPLSTFSIDVDTASYANVRRFLQQGQLPPPDAVRVEEMINYFDYAYGQPEGPEPFAAHFEMAACPWEPRHTLVRIGLKGREIPRAERPASNLVFLIDVSGSMQPANKLPLVKSAMSQLTRQLDERDTVSIVTYAGGVSVALHPTNAGNQQTILNAIAGLGAGGSTSGAAGIQTAYQFARQNYLPGGVNRVILATDGDFNVGVTDNAQLEQMIQAEARTGVFLSVYGYGMGNLKDDRLEMLANKGNGNYGYIDSETEARREFVEKLSGTLVTIAKDVKIQVEFNPARVGAYRLVGYENRALAAQDFNDDRKDAGEIGAGHTVTALYEIVPAGLPVPASSGAVDTLRYQPTQAAPQVEAARIAPAPQPTHANELLLVKLRYKEPTGNESKLLEFPLQDAPKPLDSATGDFKFASAVAAFGKLLRGNPLGAGLTYDGIMQLAQAGLANNADPHRAEMISLMLQARPMLESTLPDGRYLDSTGYLQ